MTFASITASPRLVAGAILVGVVILLGLLAGVISTADPLALHPARQFLPPSGEAYFGTDNLGMDIFARTLYAIRTDLPLAAGGVAVALVAGVAIGMTSAIVGGIYDLSIARLTDGFQAFPALLLGMLGAAVVGPGRLNLLLVIAFVWSPIFLRLTRTLVQQLKERSYVEAARSMKRSWTYVGVSHLLPNAAGPLLAQASLGIGYSILLAAALGFIGLGVPFPTPEWGAMIGAGSDQVITGYWWISVFPGVALFVAVAAFSVLAEGMHETLNPRIRT
jgi:peptide/nickel transport system permease protein